MKQKILLTLVIASFITTIQAQKKAQKITAYAITGVQKGQNNWTEVRLIDITSGEEMQTIYQGKQEIEILNARTGKAITKKEITNYLQPTRKEITNHLRPAVQDIDGHIAREKKIMAAHLISTRSKVLSDKPFATNSAACAYDKKHERLYYTPMGINQLRYIDLKAKTPKIYYFEDDQFGALTSPGDVPNQITRMVIGADGNGYALTNNGSHLIRFTTNKNATITDLGSLTDDAANGNNSIHSANGYGGDMIADKSGDMYVITANRRVFKIDIGSKVATYKGLIKGLPKGFSTNGAMVEEGSKVIVCSSNSTEGYYKFDLNTLEAEKISTGSSVYNASDLANGNLAFAKKKRNKEEAKQPEVKQEQTVSRSEKNTEKALAQRNRISVYP
ncbi:MAG: hypothetical protein M3352_04660, partial [Bacteroidota bacterium]|nr:hypothetical protein [Bacteroidota bacterium]